MRIAPGEPVLLAGSARDRGRGQAAAAPEAAEAVRAAVTGRLSEAADVLARGEVGSYLERQWTFTETVAPECIEETRGIAEGFGLDARELFAYLHLGIVADIARRPAPVDGCSCFAASHRADGVLLAKNRDFRGEHVGLQRVFRHLDPAWGGRRILCVGSLGSPGAYSSGINSDGLAVADTQVAVARHGVGLLRYFLMTRLLGRCATVAEAVEEIRATAHAGGGTLVLADAGGAVAAVELGADRIGIEGGGAGRVARTNHFVAPETAGLDAPAPDEAMAGSSSGRLATLRRALDALAEDAGPADAVAPMASHDRGSVTGLCRHGQDGNARTISCALFTTRPPRLYFRPGNPCEGEWISFAP